MLDHLDEKAHKKIYNNKYMEIVGTEFQDILFDPRFIEDTATLAGRELYASLTEQQQDIYNTQSMLNLFLEKYRRGLFTVNDNIMLSTEVAHASKLLADQARKPFVFAKKEEVAEVEC